MDWREHIPFEEGLAFILAAITIVLPLHTYLHDFPSLFGEYRTVKVLVIAAIGGAGSLSLYVGPGERLLALVPGLVAGLGAAGLCVTYLETRLPLEGWMHHLGFYPVLGVGALPGFVLMWLARRVVYRRNHRRENAP
jgi:hypothetical protein